MLSLANQHGAYEDRFRKTYGSSGRRSGLTSKIDVSAKTRKARAIVLSSLIQRGKTSIHPSGNLLATLTYP